MQEHEYYQELMSRLLDEGLTDEEQTELREHVRGCEECRRVFAAFTGMTSQLREDLADPPRDLAGGVMERIRDEGRQAPAHRRENGPVRKRRTWTRWAAAACLVLVIAGVATVSLRGRTKQDVYLPEAQNDTAFVSLPEDASGSADEPMTAALDESRAAPEEPMPEEAASSAGAAPSNTPAPSPEPSPLPVYDAARNHIGVIAPENIPAFQALVTDEGWAEGSYEYMLRVVFGQKTYAFATDDKGDLVWWEEPNTQPLLSPGTFDQLRALIDMEAPALPR